MAGWGIEDGGGGWIPAKGVVGGEELAVEELKETEANPWVLLGREEMAGGGRSTVNRDAAVEGLVDGDAPVEIGRREVVGKMREGEAELLEGLD